VLFLEDLILPSLDLDFVVWSCVNREHWSDFIFFSFFGSLVGFDSERMSILAGLQS
jgi:hypothetical protein